MPPSYKYTRSSSSARHKSRKSSAKSSSWSFSSGNDVTEDRIERESRERRLKQLEPPAIMDLLPESQPLTVCFDYPGTRLHHLQVYGCIMTALEKIPEASVESLRFAARNVELGTMWVNNRWIVEVSTKQCVVVLVGRGIELERDNVKLRRYDDVMREEYDKYQKYLETVKDKKVKKNKIGADKHPDINCDDSVTDLNDNQTDDDMVLENVSETS